MVNFLKNLCYVVFLLIFNCTFILQSNLKYNMTNTQEIYIGMFLRVKLWFTKHATALAAIPDAAAILPRLETYIQSIFGYAGEGSADETGITDKKAAAREKLSRQGILISAAGTAYALKNKLPELKSKLDYTDTDFTRCSGKTLIANITLLLKNVNPVKAELSPFGVATADVTALVTLLDDFVQLEEAPEAAIDNRSLQNQHLDTTITQVRTMLTEELDVYLKPQSIINPNLYAAYQAARLLDATGVRIAPDATVTVAANGLAVLYNKPYAADRIFYITNDGPEIIEVSLSETATAPGSKLLIIGKGDTRQRTTYNMATSGNYLVARNLGGNATQVRVWVEE